MDICQASIDFKVNLWIYMFPLQLAEVRSGVFQPYILLFFFPWFCSLTLAFIVFSFKFVLGFFSLALFLLLLWPQISAEPQETADLPYALLSSVPQGVPYCSPVNTFLLNPQYKAKIKNWPMIAVQSTLARQNKKVFLVSSKADNIQQSSR